MNYSCSFFKLLEPEKTTFLSEETYFIHYYAIASNNVFKNLEYFMNLIF